MFDMLHIWIRLRSELGTIDSLEAQWVQNAVGKDDWRRTFDARVPNNCTTEASEHYRFVTGVTTSKELSILDSPKQSVHYTFGLNNTMRYCLIKNGT